MTACPSELLERIRLRFATFFSRFSCSRVMLSTISCGERPGQFVVTVTIGLSIVGVSCSGIAPSPIRPNMTTRITPTVTETGFEIDQRIRSMERSFPS